MSVENGEWIMHGLDADDPNCIHTVEALLEVIEQVGFLPLFQNEIPGFSVEEWTDPYTWWSGDPGVDPWEWRVLLARTGKVAYGKFFNKKAGFVSKEWFPRFANYRRDGYDFDARFEDGLASYREKAIMNLFLPENDAWSMPELDGKEEKKTTQEQRSVKQLEQDQKRRELFSFEVKQQAGFGKGGHKNFDGTVAGLEMQSYLIARDFRQRTNKRGERYGWAIAVYTLPEYLWGYEYVTGKYKEDPSASRDAIYEQVKKHFDAKDRDLHKVIGK